MQTAAIKGVSQGIGLLALYNLMRLLPLPVASGFAGWIGRCVGPRLKRNARAMHNLRMVFPDRPEAELKSISREMWDNLFRIIAEYPHIPRYAHGNAKHRIHVHGGDVVQRVRDSGRPSIFFSGHIANWEISPLVAMQRGMHVNLIYRPPNDKMARLLLDRVRASVGGTLLAKGTSGARGMVRAMRRNEVVGLMVDQKLNEGISVPFLGLEAMTSPALAELSLKYEAHAVPVRVERVNGCEFRVTIGEPLVFQRSSDHAADVLAATKQVNDVVGEWVRARPGQWLWLHRRWPGSK